MRATSRRRGRVERPEWCGHCEPDSRLIEVDDGMAARCPRCHPAVQPGGRHEPRIPTVRPVQVSFMDMSTHD